MANNHSSCGCYGALNTVSGPLTHCCLNASNNSNYENYPYYSGPCPGCAANAAVTAGNGNNGCSDNCGCGNGCNGCNNCGCGNGCNGNCGCNNGCNGCNNCGCNNDIPVPVSNNGCNDCCDNEDDDDVRGHGRNNSRGRNNGRGRSNDNDCDDDDRDDDWDDNCDDDDDDNGNGDDCGCITNNAAMFEASGTFNIPANTNIPMTRVTNGTNIYSLSEEGITIRRSGMFLITYFVNPPSREMVNNEFHLALNGERLAASAILVSSNPGMQSTNASAQMLVYVQRNGLISLESQNSLNVTRSDSDLDMFTLSIVQLS